MKKSLTVISLLAGAVAVHAQGTWDLSGYNAQSSVLIYAPQAAHPATETMGAGVNDINAGATVYTGAPLGGGNTGSGPTAYGNGANYTVAIYAAPGVGNTTGLAAAEAAGTADAILTSQFLTSGGTGSLNAGTAGTGNDTAGMYAAGYLSTATTAFPGFSGGATMQILAWYSGGNNTYASDSAGTGLPFGSSAIAEIPALGGTGSPKATPGTMNSAGITSFSLMENPAVPEPSTIALGVIGASTLLFRRRK
jgi:hypothetical protein